MTKNEAIKEGFKYYCLYCGRIYKKVPQVEYEDGHGGRWIDMCCCGSDLFEKLENHPDV